ncbi:MAG TPA: hypothetical protein PLT50_04445 [bacterium]|nr:hypothetical protein [bacterium]
MPAKIKFFKKPIIILSTLVVLGTAGYFLVQYVRAATVSVSETFDNPEKIATFNNTTICDGQVKLAEETWTTLTECNCNSIDGWYWYVTNGRAACWSKTLATGVSWNKGVGNDTSTPGDYTCATEVTALKDRMIAASNREWHKIVSNVAGTTITSSHNGQAGASVISALAIADCLDGARDLCTGTNCLSPILDVAQININLFAWALLSGNKSALPYCSESGCGSVATNDYRNACEQSNAKDYPFRCYAREFFRNTRVCGDLNNYYAWVAAAGNTTNARILGSSSCSYVNYYYTSSTSSSHGFRVVLRP